MLVRWSGPRISSLAWHIVLLNGEGNVYIHIHTITLPPKGGGTMSLYCCWTIVILIDSYMTFETRYVEVLCLLTGTSQWQQLNVTLRDFWTLTIPIVDLRTGATDCWDIHVYIRQQTTLQFCDWGCDSCFSMCCNSSLLCSWNVGESKVSQAKKKKEQKNPTSLTRLLPGDLRGGRSRLQIFNQI